MIMNLRLLSILTIAALISTASATILYAQTADDFSLEQDSLGGNSASNITAFTNTQTNLTIQTFPQYPRPGDSVVAKVSGLITDLTNDSITWFLNGNPIATGPGKATASFTVGKFGELSHLTAQATDPKTGATYSANYTVSPSTVDLIWETDTYTPPFYEGKALQTAGSKVRLTAFPKITDTYGNLISPNDLIFTWKQGTTVIPDLTGRGRQSVEISNQNVIGPLNVSVTVASVNDPSLGGSASLNLTVSNPKILFYQDHPLMGILYNAALPQSANLGGAEMQIIAEPYYFSAVDRTAPNLDYTWLVNGAKNSDLANTGSAIVLKGSAGSKASASLDVRVKNADVYMQSARGTMSVVSGQSQ
jgi:hypothetical protein